MTTGTSLRQLARLIGCSEKAIRKAETAGVFKASVRRDDSGAPVVVDVNQAVKDWENSGRTLRGSSSAPRQAPAAQPEPPQSLLAESGDPGEDVERPAVDEAPVEPSPPSLVAAQREAILERARKLRMENDLREGQLVEVERVKRQAFEFARTLRESLLNIPARLSAELAAEADGARVYSRLDAAIREALETTASTFESASIETVPEAQSA